MVSKELLSEVLAEDIYEIQVLEGKAFFNSYNIWITSEKTFDCSVNIYELVFKYFKYWALGKQYSIISKTYRNGRGFTELEGRTEGLKNKSFEADTEVEAIIKACQWIMENKCGSSYR